MKHQSAAARRPREEPRPGRPSVRRLIAPSGSPVTRTSLFLNVRVNRERLTGGDMSEPIEGTAFGAVGRSCGFTGLVLACAVDALRDTPILALKAGGLLALVVTFSLLILGS